MAPSCRGEANVFLALFHGFLTVIIPRNASGGCFVCLFCQFLIAAHELGNAAGLGGIAHGHAVGLHHGAVVLLVGLALIIVINCHRMNDIHFIRIIEEHIHYGVDGLVYT